MTDEFEEAKEEVVQGVAAAKKTADKFRKARAQENAKIWDAPGVKAQSNKMERDEQLAALPDMLADAPEKKRERGDEEGAARTAQMLQDLRKLVEAMNSRNDALERRLLATEGAMRKKVKAKLKVCPYCKQAMVGFDGRGVCDGKHVTLTVLPTDNTLFEQFDGVSINGAIYYGKSVVPAACVNTIIAMVRRWERKQRQLFIPGGRIYGQNRDIMLSQLQARGMPLVVGSRS